MKITYDEALAWIHSRLTFGSRPGLERIEALLERLDNPQKKIKTIHIAGTNGKGSTVTFLRCLLESQGLIVGTFTSPYLTRFNERISINGPIPDEELVDLVARIQPLVAELDQIPELAGATEFEIITAMMYDCFYEQAVDVAIIEVGLGGKLDSTNVITPLISAITTIGFDHQDILGESLGEIALQKAGIIKAGRPVVLGRIEGEALKVITAEAKHLGAKLSRYDRDYFVTGRESLGLLGETFCFSNSTLNLIGLQIPLIGSHQIDNAALAIELYCQLREFLGYEIEPASLQKALNKAKWPGRMEQISQEPVVILDGAHNEPAMTVLIDNLKRQDASHKIHLVFAAIQTKDVTKMLATISELPNYQLYLTTFDYPKAYPLPAYPTEGLSDFELLTNWQEGIKRLQDEIPTTESLIVTGSLYFISQVRAYLLGGNDE